MFVELIKIVNTYARPVLVNVNRINYIYQCVDGKTNIAFDDDTITVKNSIDQIHNILNGVK